MQSDARTLMKVAAFCIAFSIVTTSLFTYFAAGNGDYDYDTIKAYQQELVEFSGESLLNDTPWVLTHVYTPFDPDNTAQEDYPDHIDEGGWLFGRDVTEYPYIGTVAGPNSAGIKLDKGQVSNQPLSIGESSSYSYQSGKEWWNGGNEWGIVFMDPKIVQSFAWLAGDDDFERVGYTYTYGVGNNWNYTGYRYTFDPTLPFSDGTSSKDGQLSIVWYKTTSDTGISGGLDIYGSGHKYGQPAAETRLASISATDIIRNYQTNSGYATVYDFDFDGAHINLSIKFDPNVLDKYPSFMAAWNDGAWSMTVSTASAGNFFDVENSTSFVDSTGNMVDTFIQIYTFKTPEFDDEPWVNVILWLMCGLPMTMGMLFVGMSLVGGVFKFF